MKQTIFIAVVASIVSIGAYSYTRDPEVITEIVEVYADENIKLCLEQGGVYKAKISRLETEGFDFSSNPDYEYCEVEKSFEF